MAVRFYLDPETGLPHIDAHGVDEEEVRQVLRDPGTELRSRAKTRTKLGKTSAGRYLKVVFAEDATPGDIFVITTYELRGKAKRSLRRQQRRKRR